MTRNGIASVLLVDDYEEWRSWAGRILEGRPEWKIVSEACDGPDAVKKAAELQPDIVLLDVGLPTLNGIEVARIIRQRCPTTRIIFLTENRDSDIRDAAMRTGVSGYILKADATRGLLDAIASALESQSLQSDLRKNGRGLEN